MLEEHINLTGSEWTILNHLWEHAPCSFMQLVKAMKEETGWAKSTVATVVRRMEAKGLLRYETDGKAKLFYPAIEKKDAAIHQTESLLNRLYNGNIGLLVNTLVEQKNLSKEEIADLYAILQKAEEANQ